MIGFYALLDLMWLYPGLRAFEAPGAKNVSYAVAISAGLINYKELIMSVRSTASGAILIALIQAWGLSAAQAEGPSASPLPLAYSELGETHRGGVESGLPPEFHGLELNQEQEDKIFAILHAQVPVRRDLVRNVKKAGDALRELARAEVFDAKRARDLADALGKSVAEEALLRARTEQQILAVLTPEQRQRLAQKPEPGKSGPARRDARGPQDRLGPPQPPHR